MGNPGAKYQKTRHNIGFVVVSRLAEEEGFEISRKGFSSLWAKGPVGGEEVVFLLPQTFMNRSGEAVREARDFYRVEEESLMVVHDDIDLPLGRVKGDRDAGAAGHRGVDSIIEVLGTKKFHRVRLGVGRPANKEEVESFVLSPFEKVEETTVRTMVIEATEVLKQWLATKPFTS